MLDATATPDCNEPIPEVLERISPSVVLISAITIDPFRITEKVSLSIGSGVIISADGLVLTNSHLVFGYRAIGVTLDNGQPLNDPEKFEKFVGPDLATMKCLKEDEYSHDKIVFIFQT